MTTRTTLWVIAIAAISLLIIPEALAAGTNTFSAPVPTGTNANALQGFMKGIQGILEHNLIPIIMVILIMWAGVSYASGDQETAINVAIGGVITVAALVVYGAVKDQMAAAGGGISTEEYAQQIIIDYQPQEIPAPSKVVLTTTLVAYSTTKDQIAATDNGITTDHYVQKIATEQPTQQALAPTFQAK